MRHFTRFTALTLAAALLLSGCSLSSERAEESSVPESSSPVSEPFDPLAVGLLGHTDSDSPLGTQPLGEMSLSPRRSTSPMAWKGKCCGSASITAPARATPSPAIPLPGMKPPVSWHSGAGRPLSPGRGHRPQWNPGGEGLCGGGSRPHSGQPRCPALTGGEAVTALLNSLACTLRENGLYSVGFTPGWGGLLAGRRDPGGRRLGKL